MNQPAETASSPDSSEQNSWPWTKILYWTGGLLISLLLLAYFLVPPIAGSYVRSSIISTVEERSGGTCTIQSLSVSWSGAVDIQGLTITDATEQPMVSIDAIDADIALIAALGGTYRFRALIENPVISARRLNNGPLNLASLQNAGAQSDTPSSDTDTSTGPNDGPLASTSGTIDVTGGTLRFTGPDDGRTNLTDVEMSATMEGNNTPIDLSLSLGTPGEDGGAVTASGTVQPATFRHGSINAEVKNLSLAELSPAVALFSKARNLDGRVDGDLSVSRSSELSSKANLTLTDVHVEGYGEPIDLPEATLTQNTSLDPDGTGPFSIKLNSQKMMTATMDGSVANLLGSEQALEATWSVGSDLRNASERIPSLLNLNTGWRLDGSLDAGGTLSIQPGAQRGEDRSFETSMDMQAQGTSIRATAPDGTSISLGNPSVKSDVTGQFRPSGDPSSGLPVQFGPGRVKRLTASLPGLDSSLSGNWKAGAPLPEIQNLTASLQADLEVMQTKLAPFTDFGDHDVTGTIDARVDGSGPDPFQSTARVTTDGLAVTGPDWPEAGPFNLTLEQSSTVNSSGNEIRVQHLELNGNQMMVRIEDGRIERLGDPDPRASGTWDVSVDLGTLTDKLAPLLKPRYASLLNRPDVQTVNGSLDGGDGPSSFKLRRVTDGWRTQVSGDLNLTGLAYVLENGQTVPLRERFRARINGASFHTGTSVTQLKALELRTDGLSLDVDDTTIDTSSLPPHVRSLTANLDADLARLRPLTRVYGTAPPPDMNGTIKGTVDATGEAGSHGRMTMNSDLNFTDVTLAGFDRGAAGPFTGHLSSSGDVIDLRAGESSRFHDVRLETDALSFTAAGNATGLRAANPSSMGVDLSGTVEKPEAASKRLDPFLAGYRLSGKPITVQLKATRSPENTRINGHSIRSSSLRIEGGSVGEDGVELNNLRSTGAITLTANKLSVEQLELAAEAGMLTVNGTAPINPSADVDVNLNSSLNLSLASVTPLLPAEYREGTLSGALNGQVELGGRPGQMTVSGNLSSSNLTYEPAAPNSVRIDGQEVSLSSDLTVHLTDQFRKITLNTLSMDSPFLRFDGNRTAMQLDGDTASWDEWITSFSYHPDRLNAIAGPRLPQDVTLKGSDWQSARFTLEAGSAPTGHLPYAFEGNGTYEVDRVAWKGTALRGTGTMDLTPDTGTVTWDLTSDEGTVKGSAQFDTRTPDQLNDPGERSHRFKVDARDVNTRQEMSPYLKTLHPLFGSIGGTTEGTIDLSADLNLSGPLTAEKPMERLSGPGSLSARNVQVRSGSFAGRILTLIDENTSWTVDVPTVDLRIDGRRIHHSGFPIQLSDHRLTTSGWISVDGNYKLDVNLPVTAELISEYPQLKSLKGEYLTLPISQTDGSPTVDMQSFIQKALQKTIQKQMQDQLKGLFQ